MNAGFNVVAAFDSWKSAIAVYRQNFPDLPVFELDLSSEDAAQRVAEHKPDVIIGGPPCQDFSSAGKRDESSGRAALTICFAQIVDEVKPAWFVMENVERAKKSRSLQKANKIFRRAGYGLTLVVLDAGLCGAPQKRKRLFIIGKLGGKDDALKARLVNHLSGKPTSMRDYFGDALDFEHYYRHPRSYKRRGIFSIDEPSPTIRGVSRPMPKGYPGHPGDSAPKSATIRPLTTEMRSQVQTFPERFILEGSKTDLEQMIGNAVPVKLAEYVGMQLLDQIQEGLSFQLQLSQVFEKLANVDADA